MALMMIATFVLNAPIENALGVDTPRHGGILTFVVPAEPPSFDGHRESTFAVIHPIAPFYSTLIRVNPDNPASPTDLVGDLALDVPEPTNDGRTYTFELRRNARFSNGEPVVAADVVASFRKIIFPPKEVRSARRAFFIMVKKVHAPSEYTVAFELKHPSSAFLPAVANPFNFIYSAKKLSQNMHWYEKNILGSGPFVLSKYEPGQFITGTRNASYHHAALPYLDGFTAKFSKHQSDRVKAIREGDALIEFRGFPPRVRDHLRWALGDNVRVQDSDWNCVLLATPNHMVKPFDDARVRRALSLAIDRWGGSNFLALNAIVKRVGGVVFPGHPLAATDQQLQGIAGYWSDVERSRAEARNLLREAGVSQGFEFSFLIRAIDQPYKIVSLWLVQQWRTVGLRPKQVVRPTDSYFRTLRSRTKDFDVAIDFNCESVVNPLLDVSKYISDDRSGSNWANYQDRVLDDLFDRMNRTTDVKEQYQIMRQFEKRALEDQAHMIVTLWWHRIVPHRAVVRGWEISPSHYQNQDLGTVWLNF
jgi:peptide/nickel transport system substrate-binding protein